MTDRTQLAAALQDAAAHPWALAASRAAAVSSVITDLALGRDIPEARLTTALAGREPKRQAAGPVRISGRASGKDVAVVSLRGIALYDLEFPPFAYSTRRLAETMRELMLDGSVGRIVLDIDSPGGEVTGVPEAVDAVFVAGSRKPVMALVNPLAASAAYWIASQAGEIVSVPSGDVGSIGVFVLHLDLSRAMDAAGVTPTFVFAGERKVDGNPLEPLSDRARTDLKADIDKIYGDFVRAVARGRGVPAADVRNGFGQGRAVLARDALRTKMIDRIETPPAALARFLGAASGRGAMGATSSLHGLPDDAARRRRRLAMLRQA